MELVIRIKWENKHLALLKKCSLSSTVCLFSKVKFTEQNEPLIILKWTVQWYLVHSRCATITCSWFQDRSGPDIPHRPPPPRAPNTGRRPSSIPHSNVHCSCQYPRHTEAESPTLGWQLRELWTEWSPGENSTGTCIGQGGTEETPGGHLFFAPLHFWLSLPYECKLLQTPRGEIDPLFPVSRDVIYNALFFLFWFVSSTRVCLTGICWKLILLKRPSHFLQKSVPRGLVIQRCASVWRLQKLSIPWSSSDVSSYVAVEIIKVE